MIVKRILIIDDEELIRISTQVCLEVTSGWEVMTASSARDGLLKAETEQPDVILLDVSMPDVDGLTTVNYLQANPATAGIPVILLTGRPEVVDKSQFVYQGVKAVIAKPFDPYTLADQIISVVS